MDPYPFNDVVNMLEPAVKVLNRIEIKNPDWLRVQLELAKAKYAKSKAIKEKGGQRAGQDSKTMLRSAAKVLRNVARNPSPFRDEARELLTSWNVPLTSTSEATATAPKSFADARQLGKDTIGEIEILLAELGEAKQSLSRKKNQAAQGRVDELNAQIGALAQTALDQFNLAIELADEETIRADINNVRYLQCFCYFVSGKYFESAIIAEFLLKKYPTVEGTRQSMKLLIQSYSILLDRAKESQKEFEQDRLALACNEVIKRWPGSSEAGTAAGTMTRLYLNQKDFATAEKYFEEIPANSTSRNALAVRLGQRLFRSYLVNDKANPTQEGKTRLENAKNFMLEGVKSASLDTLDYETATGALFLVDALLESGQVDEAVHQLEGATICPLDLVKNKHPALQGPYQAVYVRETYKTAIKTYLAKMKSAQNKQTWTDKASGIIAGMRQSAENSRDPKELARLAVVYRLIAKELKTSFEQIEDAGEKARFADTLSTFLGSIEEESKDSKTVLWAGSTLLSMAESLHEGGLTDVAKTYFAKAKSALTRAESMGFEGDPREKQLSIELQRQRALALPRKW